MAVTPVGGEGGDADGVGLFGAAVETGDGDEDGVPVSDCALDVGGALAETVGRSVAALPHPVRTRTRTHKIDGVRCRIVPAPWDVMDASGSATTSVVNCTLRVRKGRGTWLAPTGSGRSCHRPR